MKTKTTCTCYECQKREQMHKESEEFNFAILIALVPVITLTFFNVAGLL